MKLRLHARPGPTVIMRLMERQMPLLVRGAGDLDIVLDHRQSEQFETYFRELADWNLRVNLTSVADYDGAQVRHFLDSLTVCLAAGNPLPSGTRVVDVGAGAGFPGLPLKIAFPDICLSLVEATGKKADFLSHLTEKLGLGGVDVLRGRAEGLAHEPSLRESFDLAVSRGVARLSTLAELTLPFCRKGGALITLKHGGPSSKIQGELAAAAHALEALGGQIGALHSVNVAGLEDNRVVLRVDKTGPTPERYPRRPGIPAKRPL